MKYIIALFFVSSILFAQSDSVDTFNLPELKITQIENGKKTVYEFTEESNLFFIKDSLLTADTLKYKYSAALKNIKSVEFLKGGSFLRGALFGGIIAGSVSLLYGILNSLVNKTNVIESAMMVPGFTATGFITGTIIGGFLGSFIPSFDKYDKFSTDYNVKKEQLRKIFLKQDLNGKK